MKGNMSKTNPDNPVIELRVALTTSNFERSVKFYCEGLGLEPADIWNNGQGQALIRNGVGGTRVSFSGMFVIPILHRAEYMDISVKRIEIDRRAEQGLICKDNLRADIVVAFFVRVNNTMQDVIKVAQSLGCVRASDRQALVELFDAKFSEALKTVGKQFDFSELYTNRMRFREQILDVIGTDLSGYILEDAAIDYLEQTDKALLKPDNILDAEGIKKITLLTAEQFELANAREREKDKTITRQNVEAQEAILELNRQLAEAEAKQKREIASVQAREEAEAKKVQAGEREKSEKARIAADEEIAVADENKQRQIIVARRNKERTDAVEAERVEKDRGLEAGTPAGRRHRPGRQGQGGRREKSSCRRSSASG